MYTVIVQNNSDVMVLTSETLAEKNETIEGHSDNYHLTFDSINLSVVQSNDFIAG